MTVPGDALAEVAGGAAEDAGGLPTELLGEFLEAVVAAVADGEPIRPAELRRYRLIGDRAARDGVALRALLDLYLSAAWRLWRHLPAVRDARRAPQRVVAAGEVMLHAVDDVAAALTEGYQLARHSLARAEESARREFVDDLLNGASDVVGLLRRATGYGLDLASPHAVAVVRAEREFADGQPLVADIERVVQGRKGDAPVLVASKEGRLVIVFAAPDRAAVDEVVGRVATTLDASRKARAAVGEWRLGLGRAGTGPSGVAASYRAALEALELAARLGDGRRVVDARELDVYQLLLGDRGALAGLVESTLGALRAARGGAAPLVATLEAWFAAGGNTAAAARALHLSVRAATYRLTRIRELTGFDVDLPDDRLRLHVATLGARLLDWTASLPEPRNDAR